MNNFIIIGIILSYLFVGYVIFLLDVFLISKGIIDGYLVDGSIDEDSLIICLLLWPVVLLIGLLWALWSVISKTANFHKDKIINLSKEEKSLGELLEEQSQLEERINLMLENKKI